MSNLEKPAFVLVHGTWHGGWCWRDVSKELRNRDYVCETPSIDFRDSRSDFDDFAAQVTPAVRELKERHDKVVLVGHSRAANVIPRIAGKVAISKMIFVCGSFQEATIEQLVKPEHTIPPKNHTDYAAHILDTGDMRTMLTDQTARNYLYEDCDEEVAKWAISKLQSQRDPSNATVSQPFAASGPYADPQGKPDAYDPNLAKQLLAKAGVPFFATLPAAMALPALFGVVVGLASLFGSMSRSTVHAAGLGNYPAPLIAPNGTKVSSIPSCNMFATALPVSLLNLNARLWSVSTNPDPLFIGCQA